MKNKKFWQTWLSVFGLSVTLYLSICWVRIYSDILFASAIFCTCYFSFTWVCVARLKNKLNISVNALVVAVMLGSVILEIPVRIFDFPGTGASLLSPFIVAISIILAAVCEHERRLSVYILTATTLLLLNTVAQDAWVSFVSEQKHLRKKVIEKGKKQPLEVKSFRK